MKQWRLFLASLLLGLVVLSGCSKFHKLQKNGTVDEKYQGALDYYFKKDYFRASVLLEEVIPLLRGTEQSEKAQFYFAYCNYYLKQFVLASYYFKNFYETYPRSPLAEEANFMYCMALYDDSAPWYLDQTSTISAIEAMQGFILSYPNNPQRPDIQRMVEGLRKKLEIKAFEQAKLFHKKQDYQAAVITFENFRKDYPDSEYNEEAAWLRVSAQYYYAKNSVETKQLDRYNQLITLYQNFLDRYPSSKFARQAENMYIAAQDEIRKLEALVNAGRLVTPDK